MINYLHLLRIIYDCRLFNDLIINQYDFIMICLAYSYNAHFLNPAPPQSPERGQDI
jgi:hypothetical protein